MNMDIEPGLFGKAIDWVVAGVGTLTATVWGFLKSDVARAHKGVQDAKNDIRLLYHAAENDRAITRELIDKKYEKINDTMQLNQREVMASIADIKQRCIK